MHKLGVAVVFVLMIAQGLMGQAQKIFHLELNKEQIYRSESASFSQPIDLIVGPQSEVYVLDRGFASNSILRFNEQGKFMGIIEGNKLMPGKEISLFQLARSAEGNLVMRGNAPSLALTILTDWHGKVLNTYAPACHLKSVINVTLLYLDEHLVYSKRVDRTGRHQDLIIDERGAPITHLDGATTSELGKEGNTWGSFKFSSSTNSFFSFFGKTGVFSPDNRYELMVLDDKGRLLRRIRPLGLPQKVKTDKAKARGYMMVFQDGEMLLAYGRLGPDNKAVTDLFSTDGIHLGSFVLPTRPLQIYKGKYYSLDHENGNLAIVRYSYRLKEKIPGL